MEILLILPGFILAIIIVVVYEIKLRKSRNKLRKSQNKVHFYVTRDSYYTLYLWFGKPYRSRKYWVSIISKSVSIAKGDKELSFYGLDVKDYDNLKWEDEPIEVFLNLED